MLSHPLDRLVRGCRRVGHLTALCCALDELLHYLVRLLLRLALHVVNYCLGCDRPSAALGLLGGFQAAGQRARRVGSEPFASFLLLPPAIHALDGAKAQTLLATGALLVFSKAEVLHRHGPHGLLLVVFFVNLQALVYFLGQLVDARDLNAVFVLGQVRLLLLILTRLLHTVLNRLAALRQALLLRPIDRLLDCPLAESLDLCLQVRVLQQNLIVDLKKDVGVAVGVIERLRGFD